ncbi:MAG: amidohydrolase [Cytophagales bacterium]|nr:MAG: amidohydrolase [Cytophagales bacterium]
MKSILIYLMLISTCLFASQTKSWAQNPAAAAPQTKPIVIKNATIHIGNGEVLQNAAIRFENGLIVAIGAGIDESNAEVVDAANKHIYPGLILPHTITGLTEIQAVRSTSDFSEVGMFKPNIRSLVAYNTDSEIIPTLRSNGVLILQTTPRNGIITGTSSIMEADGWNWEDAALKADEGIHMNAVRFYGYNFFTGQMSKNESHDISIQETERFFQEALSYSKNTNISTKNLKFEAMKGLFDGTKRLYIYADFAKEILESIQLAKKYGVQKIVLVGGNDALLVADFLKENNIPIILERIHRLPIRNDEDVYLPYKLPALLKKEGLMVALAYDDFEPMGSRNLPFLAGTAAAYGLSKEEALMTITANTAKILGIDDKVGTLEKGKHATLIVSEGDLLDMRTNQITHAFIRGKKLDLDDKQKRLYQIYKQKYASQTK